MSNCPFEANFVSRITGEPIEDVVFSIWKLRTLSLIRKAPKEQSGLDQEAQYFQFNHQIIQEISKESAKEFLSPETVIGNTSKIIDDYDGVFIVKHYKSRVYELAHIFSWSIFWIELLTSTHRHLLGTDLGDFFHLAEGVHTLGDLLKEIGEVRLSRECYDYAIVYFELWGGVQEGNKKSIGYCDEAFLFLTDLYLEVGRIEDAKKGVEFLIKTESDSIQSDKNRLYHIYGSTLIEIELKQGNYRKAEKIGQISLKEYIKSGEKSSCYRRLISDLVEVYIRLKLYHLAEKFIEELVEFILNDPSKVYHHSERLRWGHVLVGLGYYKQAGAIFEESYLYLQDYVGIKALYTSGEYNIGARYFKEAGRINEVKKVLEQALLIYVREVFCDYYVQLETRMLLADVLREEGDYEGALRIIKTCEEISSQHISGEHPLCASIKLGHASILERMGNLIQANETAAQAVRYFSKNFGFQCEDSIQGLFLMSSIYISLGNFEAARVLTSVLVPDEDYLYRSSIHMQHAALRSVVHYKLGDPKSAGKFLEIAFSYKTGPPKKIIVSMYAFIMENLSLEFLSKHCSIVSIIDIGNSYVKDDLPELHLANQQYRYIASRQIAELGCLDHELHPNNWNPDWGECSDPFDGRVFLHI